MLRYDLVAWVILPALLLAGSSANSAPLESGELNANRAASTWWGFKSTWAPATAPANCEPRHVGNMSAWFHLSASCRPLDFPPSMICG